MHAALCTAVGMKLQHFSPYLSVSLPAHSADFVTTGTGVLPNCFMKMAAELVSDIHVCIYQATH